MLKDTNSIIIPSQFFIFNQQKHYQITLQHKFTHQKPMAFFSYTSLLLLLLLLQSAAGSTIGVTVWPQPRKFTWSSPPQATLLSPFFAVTTNADHHIHLAAAVRRYLRLILTEHHRPLVPPPPSISPKTSRRYKP